MAIPYGFDGMYATRNPLYNWERELQRGMPQTNPFGCAMHPGDARSREEHEYLSRRNQAYYSPPITANSAKAAVATEAPKKQSNKLLLLLEN